MNYLNIKNKRTNVIKQLAANMKMKHFVMSETKSFTFSSENVI